MTGKNYVHHQNRNQKYFNESRGKLFCYTLYIQINNVKEVQKKKMTVRVGVRLQKEGCLTLLGRFYKV